MLIGGAAGAPCQALDSGVAVSSPLEEAKFLIGPHCVSSDSMSQYVLEPYGSGT